MTQWNFDNPGAGSVSSMNTAIAILADLHEQLAQVRNLIRDKRETEGLSTDHWQGNSGDSIRERASGLEAELDTLDARLTDYQTGMSAYVTAIRAIRDAYPPLARDLASAQETVNSLNTKVRQSYHDSWNADPDDLADLTDARRSVTVIEDKIHDLETDRRSADNQLAACLGVSAHTSFALIGHALVNAGYTTPDSLTVEAIEDVLTALADAVIDGDSSDLQQLLTLLSTEPEAAAAFIERLGGARTAQFLDAIGKAVADGVVNPTTGLDAALALRHALSITSQDWSQEEADAFVAGLAEGSQLLDHTLTILFSSPHGDPMGAALTASVATLIDEHYQGEFGDFWPLVPMTGANWITAELRKAVEPQTIKEIPDLIFDTLALYPNTALGWLTTADQNGNFPRIDFWYGDDSSIHTTYDNFDALSNLWESIQTTNPYALESLGSSTEAQVALASANAAIYQALCGNNEFIPENVSDDARIHLAAVNQHLLLQFAITPLGQTGNPDGHINTVTLNDGTVLVFPNVDQAQIAELMGVISGTPFGARLLEDTIITAQDTVTTAALDGITYTARQALNFVNQTQVLLDGAMAGALDGITAREQERIDAQIEAITTITDIIIPGGPAHYVTDTLTQGLTHTFADRVITNTANHIAGEIDSPLREAIIQTGVNTWSQTIDTSRQLPEYEPDVARNDALQYWIIALEPDGVDVSNPNAVENEIEIITKDDQVLADAYQRYAAQDDR